MTTTLTASLRHVETGKTPRALSGTASVSGTQETLAGVVSVAALTTETIWDAAASQIGTFAMGCFKSNLGDVWLELQGTTASDVIGLELRANAPVLIPAGQIQPEGIAGAVQAIKKIRVYNNDAENAATVEYLIVGS